MYTFIIFILYYCNNINLIKYEMQSNTRICFDVSLKSTKLQIVKLKYVVLTTCQFGIEIAVHNLLCVNELYIIYNKHEENKKNHLKFCSVHLPLWSLELESRPFVLDEVQNARYWILDTLARFVILFVIYTDSDLRSNLPSVVMRYGAIIHGCGDFHDMATITITELYLSHTYLKELRRWTMRHEILTHY